MKGERTERDSLGELKIPAGVYYSAQTQRAVENFPISGLRMPREFIAALGLIKAAAAKVNQDLNLLDAERAQAIISVAQKVVGGELDEHFPVDVFQTGSGTSSNMNANEVIATLTAEQDVSANDHVNMGQSSNDVIPTCIQLSVAIHLQNELLPALQHLIEVTGRRAKDCADDVKTGRTHLMDAMPVTLGQELEGWVHQLTQAMERLRDCQPRLHALPQGGTAVGTGINTPAEFAERIAAELSSKTGLALKPSANFFASLSAQDPAVELSAQLRGLAIVLSKISNDLRWMNSGPLAGLGEIELQALQPGSSIMPGKVNPVIPEAVAMVSAQVIGNDQTIAIAGQSGNFQLNVMLPVIAYNLLQSLGILANAMRVLADSAIATFSVRKDNIQASLSRNPILVTALNPIIGYAKAAEIAKKAYQQGRAIIDVAEEETDLSRKDLEKLLDPAALTRGGIVG